MSGKKSDEERQKEVDRQLALMKAAIGDENFFTENDSDSDGSHKLQERSGANRGNAVEMARKFLLDEEEEEEEGKGEREREVQLGFPYSEEENAFNRAVSMGRGKDRPSTGKFGGASKWDSSVSESGADNNINLMDVSQAHGSTTSPQPNSFFSNLFNRSGKRSSARPGAPKIWHDADDRDSEEFIQKSRRFSYLACLWGTILWIVALGSVSVFGYYIYDYVTNLKPADSGAATVQIDFNATINEEIQQALVAAGAILPFQLEDPNSPQNAALKWISQDGIAVDDAYLSQRYSLAVIYFSTRGKHWANSEGWLSHQGYCTWYGVQCLGTGTSIQDENGNGQVFDVNLSSNGLVGTIPTELATFQDLYFLDLKDNQLEGTLPNNLGGWTGLRMFSVAHNELYGSIPASLLSTSPDLRILNAGHNRFTGTIPPEIGDASNLREVKLEYNSLNGHLPDTLRHLDRLETLHLEGNRLEGSLPSGIYDMDRLEMLYLHDNSLTGHLSNEFARLSHLELLTLNNNQLVGTVPNVFSQTRHLQAAQLHGNLLSGTMPPSMCALRTIHHLSYLSVDCTSTNEFNVVRVSCECCTECM